MLLDIVSNASTEICAVKKCAEDFESRSNDTQLLRSRQDVSQAMEELWINYTDSDDANPDIGTDLFAIQKYIPFKGASNNAVTTSLPPPTERKAWIARCAFRKRQNNSSTVWIITGGNCSDGAHVPSITYSRSSDSQLVRCNIDQAWHEPRLLTSVCTMSLEKTLRVRFSEIVIDLLQDMAGNWWLLQIKAFTLVSTRPLSAMTSASKSISRGLSRTLSAPNQLRAGIVPIPQWKKWRCFGRYCTEKGLSEPENQQVGETTSSTNLDKEPSGYMTKKVLRSCEFYDDFVQQQDMSLAGGFTEFHSALSFHLQHRLSKRDRSQLYEPQSLCSSCLRRYHMLRQQWIETVETSTALHCSTRHVRRTAHSKSLNHEHVDQALINPGKLPSLHHSPSTYSAWNQEASTSAFQSIEPKQLETKGTSNHENITIQKPNYLNELDAMEEMLARHEPPPLFTKATTDVQSSERYKLTTCTPSSTTDYHDDIFPKWDGVNRIEEMWQNLTLKPLERQLTDPSLDLCANAITTQGYNSISLQTELAKLVEVDDSNNGSGHQLEQQHSIDQTIDEQHDGSSSPARTSGIHTVVDHTVRVEHCRRVFEDEVYRGELVSNAITWLRSGSPNVYFTVTPHTSKSGNTKQGENEGELAEMALRSLYLDVKQAAEASSKLSTATLSLSSWPMRPKVFRETSGEFTVKLGPA
ncbi:unnamed protein product [Phytophthora fragariaefolia]|uniref:Unnamed protein product n=1 Tax=Phytophthora fragariaefolia TaxID=1490495 RepID=A0A9W6Y646_9STRA|nr:unnamed protein product [Phytophthora fragariaefolia]